MKTKFDSRMVKFFSLKNEFTILAYSPASVKHDITHKILNECRKIDSDISAIQFTGDADNDIVYNNLLFIPYSCSDAIYSTPILLMFDFATSSVSIGKSIFTVKEDDLFAFKIKGKTILSINGIEGFYRTVLGFMDSQSPLNAWFYGIISKLQ